MSIPSRRNLQRVLPAVQKFYGNSTFFQFVQLPVNPTLALQPPAQHPPHLVRAFEGLFQIMDPEILKLVNSGKLQAEVHDADLRANNRDQVRALQLQGADVLPTTPAASCY